MGYRNPFASTTALVTNTLVTTAETVVLTTGPLNLSVDTAQVLLFWWCVITAGTGVNGMTPRVRRGSTTAGQLVNVNNVIAPANAGGNAYVAGVYVDTPTSSAELQYSLTIVQSGATGNGSVVDGCLTAMVL